MSGRRHEWQGAWATLGEKREGTKSSLEMTGVSVSQGSRAGLRQGQCWEAGRKNCV